MKNRYTDEMDMVQKAHERATKIYKEALHQLRSNISPEFLLRDSMIRAEFLKRDFTKRQMNIIAFIFMLSLSCGKPKAIIPKLQDFELCGVSKTKVKDILKQLIEMDIITWDTEDNTFGIRSTLDWKAPYHDGFSDSRSLEVFNLNIRDAGIDLTGIMERVKQEGLE